jgi:hypothetical protein
VATQSGNIDVFLQLSSLQEAWILPQEFITDMTKAGHSHILVTLWVSQCMHDGQLYPPGTKYLEDFANAGWTLSEIVVLGQTSLAPPLHATATAPYFVSNSTGTPMNQIASQVRSRWNWL